MESQQCHTDELHKFIASLSIAAIGFNSQGQLLSINSAALKALQVKAEQVYLLPLEKLIPHAQEIIQKADKGKQSQFDTTARQGLTQPLDIKLSVSLFKLSSPPHTCQIAGLLLIEPLPASDTMLRDKQNELEMLSCCSGEVAHDLNNILAVISGHLELLKLENSKNDRVIKRLDSALRGVNRGRILSARLSHLAYFDRADFSLCDLNKVIAENLELIRDISSQPVTVCFNPAASKCHVNIDVSHFIDVLLNLCINAVNAMDGEPGKIEISTNKVSSDALDGARFKHYIELSVRDNGCGIDKSIQDKIFNPFFTTKRNSKSSGIGLSLVKNYMHIHQGEIKLESEKGKGACFSLYLPALESDELDTNLEKDVNMGVEQKLEGKHILVVDDEAPILLLLKEFLGLYGAKVHTADSGRDGLTLASQQDFDLILSDLVMPGDLDGADFVSTLLQQKPESSIIFMSGYTDNKLIDKAELSHIPVISKPFRKKELLNQMESSLC